MHIIQYTKSCLILNEDVYDLMKDIPSCGDFDTNPILKLTVFETNKFDWIKTKACVGNTNSNQKI